MYTALPPLLYTVAVNSKSYPGNITELRGDLCSLNLVSLTPKISNVKFCSNKSCEFFNVKRKWREIQMEKR